jgi:subtilase family serine protease
MRVSRTVMNAAGFAVLAAALVLPSAGSAQAQPAAGPAAAAPVTTHDACGPVPAGYARCLAVIRNDVHGGLGVRGRAAGRDAAAAALPTGYGPADLRAAYKLPATGGKGQTIALIDALDDPTAEADLAVYRATYGLPACTTANGCFRKVNQQGKSAPLPPADTTYNWQAEISLDLDAASATCPTCHILLVEAAGNTQADLAASAAIAPSLGATVVSNSYGVEEANGVSGYAKDYQHSGVAYVASSGDTGYTVPTEPAVYANVISVGGTTLTRATNTRGWSEAAWSGAGSGCSAWVAKPAWQHDADCPGRTVSDVSADADPATGLAVYSTYLGGWSVVGGTSASSPIIAGVIALAGNPAQMSSAAYAYARTKDLYNVTTGSNGGDCGGGYLCTAGPGYNGPTGNGTPDGTGAF